MLSLHFDSCVCVLALHVFLISNNVHYLCSVQVLSCCVIHLQVLLGLLVHGDGDEDLNL